MCVLAMTRFTKLLNSSSSTIVTTVLAFWPSFAPGETERSSIWKHRSFCVACEFMISSSRWPDCWPCAYVRIPEAGAKSWVSRAVMFIAFHSMSTAPSQPDSRFIGIWATPHDSRTKKDGSTKANVPGSSSFRIMETRCARMQKN